MNFKLEQAIDEMKTVLDMWDFMSRRTPFREEEGPNKWTEDDARAHYGTWVNDEGEKQICLSAAEQTCVKLIEAGEELARDWENAHSGYRLELEALRRKIDKLEEFAGMSDRELGLYFTKHLTEAKEYEGEETLSYIPDFYWHIAKRISR